MWPKQNESYIDELHTRKRIVVYLSSGYEYGTIRAPCVEKSYAGVKQDLPSLWLTILLFMVYIGGNIDLYGMVKGECYFKWLIVVLTFCAVYVECQVSRNHD